MVMSWDFFDFVALLSHCPLLPDPARVASLSHVCAGEGRQGQRDQGGEK